MPRSFFANSTLLLVGLSLAACAGPSVTPVATEPDLVGTRIAQATEKASEALQTIAGIEQVRTPIKADDDFSSASPSLTQPITVRWSGPIEQMAQTLAARAGFGFKTVGSKPASPITINVDVYQAPLADVLRDIGLQAGQRADLTINSRSNSVEIRYAPVDKL